MLKIGIDKPSKLIPGIVMPSIIWEISTKIKVIMNRQLNAINKLSNITQHIRWHLPIWESAT